MPKTSKKAASKADEKKEEKAAKASPAVKAPKATKTVKEEKPAATKPAKTAKAKKKAEEQAPAVPSPEKQEIIAQFALTQGDTGSPEVQIALLTRRMEKLVGHLKTNPHDNHSRRGLLGLVSKRRRLLNYLESKDPNRFKVIKTKLGLT